VKTRSARARHQQKWQQQQQQQRRTCTIDALEPRLLLAVSAPKVAAVYVASSQWSPTFKSQLASIGKGSAQYGFAVPGGNFQSVVLPWRGLNQVSLEFTQDVDIEKDNLTIYGVNVPQYSIGSFAYNAGTRTATWTLQNGQAFVNDNVKLDLDRAETGIYDTGGFEFPRFSTADLEGQDATGGQDPWRHVSTAGSAFVEAGAGLSGQGVTVRRGEFDERWAVRKTLQAPASPVSVQWDMYVTQTTLPLGSFGPYFAVEAYDELGNPPKLAGSAGVDAATGEVLYQAAGTGVLTPTGGTASFNAWHHFEMVLNYQTDTYDVRVDNVEVASDIGFVDAGVDDFTDAPIAALAAGGDPASQKANGVARFDNYKIINADTLATHYDSNGFEAPRFNQANLQGNDMTQGPWLYQGAAGSAVVTSAKGSNSQQSVAVARGRADERWGIRKVIANPTKPVSIKWDQWVTQTTLPSGSFGPYFAVEAYDELGNVPRLAGSAGVDAATGEVLYQAGGTGFITSTGKALTFDGWHHFEMLLDYQTDTYDVFVDNVQLAADIGFVDAGVNDFTDASIAALAAGADPASQNASGLAFFDNYRIELSTPPVTNSSGLVLDGEWANSVSDFPSGDGLPGGAFRFDFNVLEGDFTGDGVVDFNDLVVLAQHYNQPSFGPSQGDSTADGMTDFNDLVSLAQNYNTRLPNASPAAVAALASAPSFAVASASLPFSVKPISASGRAAKKEVFAPKKAPVYAPVAPKRPSVQAVRAARR
jgi:hypothetical protein